MSCTAPVPASPRILFLVTEDWYFASHRLALAVELIKQGWQVAVGCRFSGTENTIRQHGVVAYNLPLRRESVGLGQLFNEVRAVRRFCQTVPHDLLHLVALRPVILAGLGRVAAPKKPTINALAGLGSLFSGELPSLRLRLLKVAVGRALRQFLRPPGSFTVFQNHEDLRDFAQNGIIAPERSFLVRGSGVNVNAWEPTPEPRAAPPIILFAGRLLKDKGVLELLEASRILRSRGVNHVLRLAGLPDFCNPKSLTAAEIEAYRNLPEVEWLGQRTNILATMSEANLVVLPSYREGLPQVLVEAGVACRAVVTSDVVGCREIIHHLVNGWLVKPRDPDHLATTLAEALTDAALRERMARTHREIVVREFGIEPVAAQFVRIYRHALQAGANH
ncbi:MAG: glycosyltransferase family 4 protein [Verrucomicrobiota bacterium]